MRRVHVKLGDTVSPGQPDHRRSRPAAPTPTTAPADTQPPQRRPAPARRRPPRRGRCPAAEAPRAGAAALRRAAPAVEHRRATNAAAVHASPSVRRLARELGVDLNGSPAPATRDASPPRTSAASATARSRLRDRARSRRRRAGSRWPRVPDGRFAKFGPVERVKRSRIQRISGPRLRAQLGDDLRTSPSNDEADITELEAWRKRLNDEQAQGRASSSRCWRSWSRACVAALQARSRSFNASLDGDENLVLQAVLQHRLRRRHAQRAGGAGDQGRRPQGHQRDRARAGRRSREGPRRQARPRATCRAARFTISSLGGIGGTAFTPIINAPEVAILGVIALGDEAGLERRRVRAAADAAAVAVLRPSRDRRRRCRALRRASRRGARRRSCAEALL